MFCALGLIFGGTDGGSHFHGLRSRTRFRRYRGHRVPFSCFALPDSYSTVPRASGPFFIFCAPGLIFGGTVGVGSRFHVLRSRTRFRRYRGRRVLLRCVVLSDSFLAVPSASGLVFMFSAPGLVFGYTEGVGSCFHVLRSRTRFRRYRGFRFSCSCFARPDSFSTVPRASGPVFMFCAPRLIFGGTVRVGSRFHVFSIRTRFRRYRGVESHSLFLRARTHFRPFQERRVPFSRFALPDSYLAETGSSGPVFLFCAPGVIFGDSECVGSRFPIFAPPYSFSAVPRASSLVFMFCAPGLVFGGTVGVGSRFHVFCSRTRFRWYQGHRVPHSCFALPDSLSAVPKA
jgi:hypothetical protein